MTEYERHSLALLCAIAGGISSLVAKPPHPFGPGSAESQAMREKMIERILRQIEIASLALEEDTKNREKS